MKPATPGFTLIFLCIHPSFSSSATDIQLLLLLLGNNCNYYLRRKRRGESNKYRAEDTATEKQNKTKPEQDHYIISISRLRNWRQLGPGGRVGMGVGVRGNPKASDSETETQSPPAFLEKTRKRDGVPEDEALTYFRSLWLIVSVARRWEGLGWCAVPFDRVEPGSQPCLVARCPQATPETHGESHGGLSRGRAGREGGPCDHPGGLERSPAGFWGAGIPGVSGEPFCVIVFVWRFWGRDHEWTWSLCLHSFPTPSVAICCDCREKVFVWFSFYCCPSRALENTEVDERCGRPWALHTFWDSADVSRAPAFLSLHLPALSESAGSLTVVKNLIEINNRLFDFMECFTSACWFKIFKRAV